MVGAGFSIRDLLLHGQHFINTSLQARKRAIDYIGRPLTGTHSSVSIDGAHAAESEAVCLVRDAFPSRQSVLWVLSGCSCVLYNCCTRKLCASKLDLQATNQSALSRTLIPSVIRQ